MDDKHTSSPKPLVIKTNNGFEFYDCKSILRFQASGNSCLAFIRDRKEPLKILINLSIIEEQCAHALFFRCHRSHLVNIYHIQVFNDKTKEIILSDGSKVPVSETCIKDLICLIKEVTIYLNVV